MSGIKATEIRYSLKDQLFNKQKVAKITREIKAVHPAFADKKFVKKVVDKFPKLELMERVYHIRDCLREFLPAEYRKAATIILKSLPPALDPKNTDNDFGDFIYGPYGYFVATYGSEKKDVTFSLRALNELTKRFSMEGPIRDFLNTYPEETLAAVERWSKDKNYHVRRLASEGTRPFLPWAPKINTDPRAVLPILDRLHADPTRYVTRSVANHLNDLSKIDAKLVVDTLKTWRSEGVQSATELDFITKHALRTLVKKGDDGALRLLGFSKPNVSVSKITLQSNVIQIGEALSFSFIITSVAKKSQKLLIDYELGYQKANGSIAPKVHKLKQCTLAPGDTFEITKKHRLQPMSTRTLYPGKHTVCVLINGKRYSEITFELVA